MLLIKHYLFSIIIEDCGKTEGTGTPWRNRRQRQDPPFTFFLCPAAMGSLVLGQRDQYVHTDGREKGSPTEPAHPDTE